MLTKKDKSFVLLVLSFIIVAWFLFFKLTPFVLRVLFHNFEKNYEIVVNSSDGWLNVDNLKARHLKNKITLISFLSHPCSNCFNFVGMTKEWVDDFGNNVVILGVFDETSSSIKDIKNAILRYDIKNPVFVSSDLKSKLNIDSDVAYMLINPKGIIEKIYGNEVDVEEISSDIEDLVSDYGYMLNKKPLPILLEKDNFDDNHILKFPSKLEYSSFFRYGNTIQIPAIFISNSGHNNIVVTSLQGRILLKVGSGKKDFDDGKISDASFNNPGGLLFKNDILYIADTGNNALRKVDFRTGVVSTLIGSGVEGKFLPKSIKASDFSLNQPLDIKFFPDYNNIVISNHGTGQLLQYNLKKNTISPFIKSSIESMIANDMDVFDKKLYFVNYKDSFLKYIDDDRVVKLLTEIQEGVSPSSLNIDDIGYYLNDNNSNSILKYDVDKFEVYKLQSKVKYNYSEDILSVVNKFYIADTYNHRIVVIDRITRESSILDILPKLELSRDELLEYISHSSNIKEEDVTSEDKISISIKMKEGWKINDGAPSFINLIEVINEKEGNLITTYDWNNIKSNQIILPKLTYGNKYYLQGVIYYCEDKELSLCKIYNYKQVLNATDVSNNEVEINLGYDLSQ